MYLVKAVCRLLPPVVVRYHLLPPVVVSYHLLPPVIVLGFPIVATAFCLL
ncbi:hypothetical protein HMPREF3190_00069 [Umbribacter vaginalis]|nr:hypothetical protein HMPREF3190_00069 [Coriobacteriales bacterium DNF00809]